MAKTVLKRLYKGQAYLFLRTPPQHNARNKFEHAAVREMRGSSISKSLTSTMATKALPTDLPIIPFRSAADFESFLEREHLTSPGIWLKMGKKVSNVPSVSLSEAVEVALCFGWINGQGRAFDDKWCLSRYTPRRPKSMWSKINVDTVARLEAAGRMRPAGIAAVEAAKADGRWERAYAAPSTIQVPDDFAVALAEVPAAAAFFAGLNKTGRYAVLWRVETASPQSRAKRIETLVTTLAEGKVPGHVEAGKGKRKSENEAPKSQTAAAARSESRKKSKSSSAAEKEEVKPSRRAGLRSRQ